MTTKYAHKVAHGNIKEERNTLAFAKLLYHLNLKNALHVFHEKSMCVYYSHQIHKQDALHRAWVVNMSNSHFMLISSS